MRDVIECGGAVVEFSPNALKLGDAFALLLLLRTMGETFVARIGDLCSGASRDTVDRHMRKLEDGGLVVRERISRSEYRYQVVENVPRGNIRKK